MRCFGTASRWTSEEEGTDGRHLARSEGDSDTSMGHRVRVAWWYTHLHGDALGLLYGRRDRGTVCARCCKPHKRNKQHPRGSIPKTLVVEVETLGKSAPTFPELKPETLAQKQRRRARELFHTTGGFAPGEINSLAYLLSAPASPRTVDTAAAVKVTKVSCAFGGIVLVPNFLRA